MSRNQVSSHYLYLMPGMKLVVFKICAKLVDSQMKAVKERDWERQ